MIWLLKQMSSSLKQMRDQSLYPPLIICEHFKCSALFRPRRPLTLQLGSKILVNPVSNAADRSGLQVFCGRLQGLNLVLSKRVA